MYILEARRKLNTILSLCPELAADPEQLNIARALIYTNGHLDGIEFLTQSSLDQIMKTYQLLESTDISWKIQQERQISGRSFTRNEMVQFLKSQLQFLYPDIKFISLKYSILTCQLHQEIFTIYLSTSKDYNLSPDYIRAWHKGHHDVFTLHDYYAFLVKPNQLLNTITGFITTGHNVLEWIDLKRQQNKIINFDIEYKLNNQAEIQSVRDLRETPPLEITSWYRTKYSLEGR